MRSHTRQSDVEKRCQPKYQPVPAYESGYALLASARTCSHRECCTDSPAAAAAAAAPPPAAAELACSILRDWLTSLTARISSTSQAAQAPGNTRTPVDFWYEAKAGPCTSSTAGTTMARYCCAMSSETLVKRIQNHCTVGVTTCIAQALPIIVESHSRNGRVSRLTSRPLELKDQHSLQWENDTMISLMSHPA